MAVTRQQKDAQLAARETQMKKAVSVVFTNYIGLTVTDITKLRSNLKKEKAEMKVAKKSLIRLALKKTNNPEIDEKLLPGPVACIFSMGEPTSGANVTYKFGKDHAQVKLIGGIFSNKVMTASETISFATIPSKQELLGMFMSLCSAPLTQFVGCCAGPLTGFARALSELANKKQASVPAPVAADPAPVAA